MTTFADVQRLVTAKVGGWVARGLLGPTVDELSRLAAEAGWRFVEVSLVGVRDKKTLMGTLADQLHLESTFGANWDALAAALGEVEADRTGVILRLKGLGDIPEMLAQPFVEVLDQRTHEGPALLIIVADPPLPECAINVSIR